VVDRCTTEPVRTMNVLGFSLVLLLAGASCNLPRDSNDTLNRVRQGMLRVGITENPPWSSRLGDSLGGVEVELVQGAAARLSSALVWTSGTESELLRRLHERKLDLVIGGLSRDNPWSSRVAFTRPYYTDSTEKRVMAVSPGENAWLSWLERWLHSQEASVPAMLRAAGR
jgi:polar amino acid transport system substrate-binding protein